MAPESLVLLTPYHLGYSARLDIDADADADATSEHEIIFNAANFRLLLKNAKISEAVKISRNEFPIFSAAGLRPDVGPPELKYSIQYLSIL